MQLELLKLYKPQCLEILESLRIVSEPAGPPGNDDDDDEDTIGSRIDNEKVFMLKYIYYILNIGLTHRPCIRNAVYNINAWYNIDSNRDIRDFCEGRLIGSCVEYLSRFSLSFLLTFSILLFHLGAYIRACENLLCKQMDANLILAEIFRREYFFFSFFFTHMYGS